MNVIGVARYEVVSPTLKTMYQRFVDVVSISMSGEPKQRPDKQPFVLK